MFLTLSTLMGLRVDEDVRPIFDYLKDYRHYIDKWLTNPDEIEGITTGIEELTGGFKEGELSILAARTSIGKTSIDGSRGRKALK